MNRSALAAVLVRQVVACLPSTSCVTMSTVYEERRWHATVDREKIRNTDGSMKLQVRTRGDISLASEDICAQIVLGWSQAHGHDV